MAKPICKHCSKPFETFADLKAHAAAAHTAKWRELQGQLKTFDALNIKEMDRDCPTCPHKHRGGIHTNY